MSLPRVATLGAGAELVFAPGPVETLRRDHVRLGSRTLSGREVLAGVSGNQLDLELDVELEPGSVFRLGVLGSVVPGPGPGPGSAEETVIEIGYATGGSGFSQSYLRLDHSRTSLDLSVDADEKSGPVIPPAANCTCASWWTVRRWKSSPTENR